MALGAPQVLSTSVRLSHCPTVPWTAQGPRMVKLLESRGRVSPTWGAPEGRPNSVVEKAESGRCP